MGCAGEEPARAGATGGCRWTVGTADARRQAARVREPGQPCFARSRSWSSCAHRRGGSGRWRRPRSTSRATPYRGFIPNELSARITPHGGGLLVGTRPEPTRRDAGRRCSRRDPGGRFQRRCRPRPPMSSFRQAGRARPRRSPTDLGSGRCRGDRVRPRRLAQPALLRAEGPRSVEDAVIHCDGESWSREPVEVRRRCRSAPASRIVAIARDGADNAWLVAAADPAPPRRGAASSAATSGQPHWVERDSARPCSQSARRRRSASRGWRCSADTAQPLTVTATASGSTGAAGDRRRRHRRCATSRSSSTLTRGGHRHVVRRAALDGGRSATHPLGVQLLAPRPDTAASPGPGDGFGTRVITNPLDAGGDVETQPRHLPAARWRRASRGCPARAATSAPSGAFSARRRGLAGGPGAGHALARARPPRRKLAAALRGAADRRRPAARRDARRDSARGALAVGADGAVARYAPGQGWTREFLLTSSGRGRASRRCVASPGRSPAAPTPSATSARCGCGATRPGCGRRTRRRRSASRRNLMDVAFDPGQPGARLRGRQGRRVARLRQDAGPRRRCRPASARRDFTLGRVRRLARRSSPPGSDLLVNDGGGWRVDAGVAAAARRPPGSPRLFAVAGLPDGGAVAAGRDVVLERDGAGGPWRFADQPLPGSTVVAAAAVPRRRPRCARWSRSVPSAAYPPADNLPPPDPNVPPPSCRAFPLPGDGYVLRETADGGATSSTPPSPARGRPPVKSDPVLALRPRRRAAMAGRSAAGAGRPTARAAARSGRNAAGPARSPALADGGVYRYGAERLRPRRRGGRCAAAVPGRPGAVRRRRPCPVRGARAPTCAPGGSGRTATLAATLAKVARPGARRSGPRFFLYTGGRVEAGGASGATGAEAGRYAACSARSRRPAGLSGALGR